MNDDFNTEASRTGLRRRQETLWATLRSFGRLWGFLAFLVGVVVLFRGIVLPFVFGLLVAYMLAPIVARLQPHVGRVAGVLACYVVMLGMLAAFIGLLLPAVASDFARLRNAAPVAIERFNAEWLPRAEAWIESEFQDFLFAPDPDKALAPPAPDNELLVEPLGDGTFRIDLEHVNLTLQPQDDGSWAIGPPLAEAPTHAARTDVGDALREFIRREASRLGPVLGPAVQALIGSVVEFVTNFVITFMIAAFVLVDLTRVNLFVRSLIPSQYRGDFEELWDRMDRGLSGVIRGQLLICLVNGALTLVGLLVFKVKYAFLLALLAAGLSLIPIFGTIISSIPILVIALMSGDKLDYYAAFGMLAWISGIHLLEANVFNPKIIGDSANIHPVIVIFALLAGEHVFGLVGALLAIPVTSLVQALYLHARMRSSVFAREQGYE